MTNWFGFMQVHAPKCWGAGEQARDA